MPYQVLAAGRVTLRTPPTATYNELRILGADAAGNLAITFATYREAFRVKDGANIVIKILPAFLTSAGAAGRMLVANYVALNQDTFTVRITDVAGELVSGTQLAQLELMIEVSQFGPAVVR